MLFPIIRVRDNDTKHERILGTNSHDTLYIDEVTGGIQYLNQQCCEGTERFEGEGRSTFDFLGVRRDEDYPYAEIEFVTFDELLEIYKEQIEMSCEHERAIRDMFKTIIANSREKHNLDEDEGEISHT